jgi:hypothetical protein
MERPDRTAKCLAQVLIGLFFAVIPGDILKSGGELGERIRVHAAVFL